MFVRQQSAAATGLAAKLVSQAADSIAGTLVQRVGVDLHGQSDLAVPEDPIHFTRLTRGSIARAAVSFGLALLEPLVLVAYFPTQAKALVADSGVSS
jgi:hypothetical protein